MPDYTPINRSGIAAGTQTATSGTVVFSNSNGVTFGMSNSSVVTASVAAAAAGVGLNTAQTNVTWTVNTSGISLNAGGYAGTGFTSTTTAGTAIVGTHNTAGLSLGVPAYLTTADLSANSSNYFRNWKLTGNTAGTTSSAQGTDFWLGGGNGITISGSSNTISLSVGNYLTTQSGQAFSADASSTFQTLTLQNSNGISFSNNAGAVRVTHDLQYTSATSAITSNALNTSASRVINVVAATNNTGGGTASLSSNVSFSNANGLTFYTSAGNAIVGSYTVPSVTNSSWTVSDSATSATVGRLAFTASNGLTLTLSTSNNGNHTVIGSYTVPTVPAQLSVGVSTGGNTTGDTGLFTGRVAFAGGANITLSGSSNAGSVTYTIVGATVAGQPVNFSAGTTSNNLGSVVFSNSNLVSFGLSGSTITGSVPGTSSLSATGWASISTNGATISIGASTTMNLYASSNTFGTFSGTADMRSISIAGSGWASVAASNSGWVVSVPVGRNSTDAVGLNTAQTNVTWTVNSNGISLNAGGYAGTVSGATNCAVTVNTSGVSVSIPYISYQNLAPAPWGATATTQFAQSTSYMVPFVADQPMSVGSVRMFEVGSNAASSTQALVNGSTLSMTGATSHNFVFYTRGTGANSMSLQYVTSTQVVDQVSMNVQNAAGANSSQLSYTYRFSLGNTSFTKDYSSTAQSYNFHTSGITDLTGTKQVDYPCGVSLSAGQWFLGYGRSTTFATQNAAISVATRMNISYDSQFVVSQNTLGAIGTLGGGTNSSVMFGPLGLGSYSTGGAAGTTNSLNISVISSGASNQVPPFQLLRIA